MISIVIKYMLSIVPIMDPRYTSNSNQASGQRQFSQDSEEDDPYVNYSYPQGQVYCDRELFTGGFSFETGTSHYTRLGLPNQPSPSSTQASSSPDSVTQIDVSVV